MTRNDTGLPGRHQTIRPYMMDWVRNHFVVVSDNLNRQPVVIGGVPLHESSYGFGTIVAAQMGPRARKYEVKE